MAILTLQKVESASDVNRMDFVDFYLDKHVALTVENRE